MDFLLSLSAKAKEKLNTAKIVNKGVTYFEQLLSEEDTKWVFAMKKTIADYLRQGTEGPYFFRMVETVLSRDKNWVRWKIENCPSIEKPPVSPEEFCEAKAAAQKLTTNKRLRPTPMGSLSLGFLSDVGEGNALQKLKSQERYVLPDLMSFKRKIADDDFEIEMPTNNQTKAAAIEGKASKSWRALRIASRYKLATFDKLDNPEKIDLIFEDDVPQEAEELEDTTTGPAHVPEDRRPVIITGPQGSNKSSLVKMLLEKESGAFGKVAAHITRQPENGETNGREYHFVEAQAFAMMRDGDQLLAFTDAEGVNYGTSRRAVESISDSGKVPLLEMDRSVSSQIPPLTSTGFRLTVVS
jgi:THO complex subunit 1